MPTTKSSGRKYSKKAGKAVKRTMHALKRGTLKSGRSGKKVKSRKQAIAVGLSEARKAGAKVPKKNILSCAVLYSSLRSLSHQPASSQS